MATGLMGLMQHHDLTIASLIEHSGKVYGATELVSRTIEDNSQFHTYTYSDALARSKQLASALGKLGVEKGDRVATIAWNGYRHFEAYYGVSGMGAVLHTINPRLHPDQMVYILGHAEDKVLMVDLTFYKGALGLLQAKLPSLKTLVVLTDRANMPADAPAGVVCFEDLIGAESAAYEWPKVEEGAAAAMCYTSGTTGNPKAVLYSHRSTVLHAWNMVSPNVFGLGSTDTMLPVVPMFHVNAWGLPYASCIAGCKVVFPGAAMDGASIYDSLKRFGVNKSAGVPTVYGALLQHMSDSKSSLPDLNTLIIGGAACPPSMIRAFDEHGVDAVHAWGMTEMSPTGVCNTPKHGHEQMRYEEKFATRVAQGRQLYGCELKCVGEGGEELPRDGKTSGTLMVRGNWVCQDYYKTDKPGADEDGWFDTGDVACIDSDGYLFITDRTKDMIKSGGEWISSIDIENVALEHPGLAQAACIGVPHAKWGERPLLVVVAKGEEPPKEEILSVVSSKVHKFQVPDDVIFVKGLPIGGTGKILKRELRDEYRQHLASK